MIYLYCAFILLSHYQAHLFSDAEFIAQFWLLYAYFKFLTFLIEETLRISPYFFWPTHLQLEEQHPGGFDFIHWPKLRSFLAQNHQEYDYSKLVAITT